MADVIDLTGRRKLNGAPIKLGTDQASTAAAIIRRDQTVTSVRLLEREIQATEGAALPFAMEIGDRLAEFKAEFKDSAGHGRWLPFLRDCQLPPRRAQIYMFLAAERATIEAANANRDSYLSIAAALKLIRSNKPKPERNEPDAQDPVTVTATTITIAHVLEWLPKASPEDKRRVAVALAQDTVLMKSILPAKTLPHQATSKQVYDRAMGLLSADGAPPVTH